MTALYRASSRDLLARVLETPDLAEQVRALPAPVLASLVERVGLEDAGEIVAFATTAQLASLFDDDLWKSDAPGEDERFDGDRFVVWLAVMLEAGDAFVADRLAELPIDLVTLAFHRRILVLDVESLFAEMRAAGDDASMLDKALESALSEEIDAYQILAKKHDGWDDVLSALLALDRDHHDCLARILERCAAMDQARIEDEGLYEVLTAGETLEEDVAAEREDRRAEAGHVVPSSAAAFLALARDDDGPARDPLTRAWFRALGTRIEPVAKPSELARLVSRAAPRERRLAAPGAREPLVSQGMREIAGEEAFAARSEELAYLANVLRAGCTYRGAPFRPADAVRAAIAIVSLGIDLSGEDAATALRGKTCDHLFRVAWKRLHAGMKRAGAAAMPVTDDDGFPSSVADLARVGRTRARLGQLE